MTEGTLTAIFVDVDDFANQFKMSGTAIKNVMADKELGKGCCLTAKSSPL